MDHSYQRVKGCYCGISTGVRLRRLLETGVSLKKDAERRDKEERAHRGGHEAQARPVKTFHESAISKRVSLACKEKRPES